MCPKPEYVKIASLDNEIEARLLESLLLEQNIPHVIHSYYDLAYDGLFQAAKGWGHVEGAKADREPILESLRSIRQSEQPENGECPPG